MDRCMFRNNIHRLSEIQEESQFTLQNSQDNTQINFNKGGKYAFKRKRINSQNQGNNGYLQTQIYDQYEEGDSQKIMEITIPNQNALRRPQLKKNKQVQGYDQVRNTIIKNIYCSNQQEKFFKQYVQTQLQQQQSQLNGNQNQYQDYLNMGNVAPHQIQITNPQERQTSLSSYQYTASTSASTTQNSINSKKQQHIYSPLQQFLPYAKNIQDQTPSQNNQSFHQLKGSSSANRNSPGQSYLSSQKVLKLIQNDGQDIIGLPKRMERKIKYIEKFSSATVYLGKANNPKPNNNLKQVGYLPPVKNIINRSIDNIEQSHSNTQPNLNACLLASNPNQRLISEISTQAESNIQYERSASSGNKQPSRNLIRLEKPLIDYKEDELSECLSQSQKQKSIFQKQKQQLEKYNQLYKLPYQSQLHQNEKENSNYYSSPQNKQLQIMNKTMSSLCNSQIDSNIMDKTLTKLEKIEMIENKKSKEIIVEREKTQYECQPPISKKQFEQFLLEKQKTIDEKINSLQVTDQSKVKELKYLLQKQKGNQKQSSTSISFYLPKDERNVKRTHSSNDHHKKYLDQNLSLQHQRNESQSTLSRDKTNPSINNNTLPLTSKYYSSKNEEYNNIMNSLQQKNYFYQDS